MPTDSRNAENDRNDLEGTAIVESRRKRLANHEKQYPGAAIIDVTSKGDEPWVRFSPFFPHGGIPIPNSPGEFAQSVEGL